MIKSVSMFALLHVHVLYCDVANLCIVKIADEKDIVRIEKLTEVKDRPLTKCGWREIYKREEKVT